MFIDLSLGITGPLAGAVAAGFGFASIFLFAALAALSGLALSVYLYRQAPKHFNEKHREQRDTR
ncbi:major facilitator superfamily transporter [compost metagenome]